MPAVFDTLPDVALVADVLGAFGITDVSKQITFTKHDTDALDTFGAMYALTPRLKAVYRRGVWSEYVTVAHDDRTILSVLRHFLRLIDCSLAAHDRHCPRCGRDRVYTVRAAHPQACMRRIVAPVCVDWVHPVLTPPATGAAPGRAGMVPRSESPPRFAAAQYCMLTA